MSETDYFKFIVGDDVESQRRMALIQEGIKNAKKIAARPVAYRWGKKAKMIQAIKQKSYEGI